MMGLDIGVKDVEMAWSWTREEVGGLRPGGCMKVPGLQGWIVIVMKLMDVGRAVYMYGSGNEWV